jgi:hypothetical protein
VSVGRPGELPVQRFLGRVALDDDRLIEQQLAALGAVPPDALALGEGRRSAEALPEDLQRLADPRKK